MVTIEYRNLAVLALFRFCTQANYDYTKEYTSQCVSTCNAYHNNTKLSLELLKYICLPTCMTGEGVYLPFSLSHLLHCHIIVFNKLFNRRIAIQLSGKYKQNVDILSEGPSTLSGNYKLVDETYNIAVNICSVG